MKGSVLLFFMYSPLKIFSLNHFVRMFIKDFYFCFASYRCYHSFLGRIGQPNKNKYPWKNKYITQTTTWDLFRLLTNCFLLFCSDMAVLIFPTLLVDFQGLNQMSGQGFGKGTYSYLTPSPISCFKSRNILFVQIF